MTITSRIVLQDVKHAIDEHKRNSGGESFRVSWFSIVGLLRAVGNVLNEVDSQRSIYLKKAIAYKWNEISESRPHPRIFWCFIKEERDLFLKNYEHSVNRYFTLKTYNSENEILNTVTSISLSRSRGISGITNCETVKSVVDRGFYLGKNEKEVALEAYNWWCNYLDAVDQLATEYEKNA